MASESSPTEPVRAKAVAFKAMVAKAAVTDSQAKRVSRLAEELISAVAGSGGGRSAG
jgi:ribosomal protein S7